MSILRATFGAGFAQADGVTLAAEVEIAGAPNVEGLDLGAERQHDGREPCEDGRSLGADDGRRRHREKDREREE